MVKFSIQSLEIRQRINYIIGRLTSEILQMFRPRFIRAVYAFDFQEKFSTNSPLPLRC